MTEKVVYLAYHNDKVTPEREMLSCGICKNKTYVLRYDCGKWPEIHCAACGQVMGAFGWTQQQYDENIK